MPFNGPITFHELALTIPDGFIRDSTQSTQDAWLFEKGFYSRLIILTRNDQNGDVDASLDSYRERMKEIGAASERTTFLDQPAVHSAYTKDNTYCQEILFIYHGSYYAVALRGGICFLSEQYIPFLHIHPLVCIGAIGQISQNHRRRIRHGQAENWRRAAFLRGIQRLREQKKAAHLRQPVHIAEANLFPRQIQP